MAQPADFRVMGAQALQQPGALGGGRGRAAFAAFPAAFRGAAFLAFGALMAFFAAAFLAAGFLAAGFVSFFAAFLAGFFTVPPRAPSMPR